MASYPLSNGNMERTPQGLMSLLLNKGCVRSKMDLQEQYQNVCRFCLNQDSNRLAPLSTIVKSSLPVKDVEIFTGIEISMEELNLYALCIDCHMTLLSAVSYRNTCLANDAYFRELCLATVEFLDEAVDCSEAEELVVEERKETVSEIQFVVMDNRKHRNEEPEEIDTPASRTRSRGASAKEPPAKESPTKRARTRGAIGKESSKRARTADAKERVEELKIEVENYCANRIELGESFSSDDDVQRERKPTSKVILDKETLFAESLRLIRETQQRNEQLKAELVEGAGDESDSTRTPAVNENCSKASKHQLCEVCGKVVQKLSDHITIHTKELRYACPHCPMRMANHGNLHRHVQAVHLKRVIKSCEMCDKGFTSKASYKSHMRSEHGIGETYECKLCPKKFNHPGNYRVHFIRCHSEERKFSCNICGKQFKEKRDHRNHQRVHSDDKPFICAHCPKRFKSEFARKTHELTHSGIVFKCAHCNKCYRYKCLLNMHMKKAHAEINAEDGND